MTRSVTFFIILFLSFSIFAEEIRPKIGLVLSGGGAKGAAHLGVLKVLEANRIPVDYIAGTSIGAYVAGMYALGYTATEIEKIMLNETWSDGYSDTIPRQTLTYRDKQHRDTFNIPINLGYSDEEVQVPNGLLRGQTMSQLLQRSTGLVNQFGHFDELAIPYRAVATDLETSQAVVISNGSIVKAMQASATVPGALQPVSYEGKLLIDGGIANNMPVDVVKALGADIIIAVDIGSALVKKENLTSTIAVLNQLSTMLTNASTDKQKLLLTSDDILIRPDVGEMSTTDFTIMAQAFSLGEQAALEHLVSLQGLSVDKEQFKEYQERKKVLSRGWLDDVERPIVNIVFNNESKVSESLLRETLGLEEGDVVTEEELAKGIAEIYSLDKFERVNAEFIDTEDGRVLTINTAAKSWGPNYFQFGFSWEDDFSLDSAVAFDFAYTMTDLTATGGEWRNELKLGYEKLISTEFYQPLDYDQGFYSRAKASYEINDWEFFDDNSRIFQLNQKQYRGDLGIGYNYVKEGMVEIGFTGEKGKLENALLLEDLKYNSYGGYFKFGFDNLDSINFPTSGNRLTLDVYYRKEDSPTISHIEPSEKSIQIELDWRGALSLGNHAFVGIASLATVDKDAGFSVHVSELGGFLNLSGYHKNALVGPHKVFGAFVYQYDLGRDVLGMTDYPLYLGTSIEAGNVWTYRDSVDLDDLIYSGSLYFGTDTSMGPAALGFGWADDGEKAIFLFIGKSW
ncbi:patatin-like phospholipase family protein [Shewanella eurypsychrophilus]|uniref:Patatin-like phospholipase family protein n=1 Tax=Shewanella eurypsychrophilus TaxID=2593656 RepID=A0ABX6V128_9GAMM|nr:MULTISPECIES: patatin-like phospholipase family protein [Shewanella]QFU21033.1 patatin [Shewanella sp. YLB-09]QPG56322.1 patatin-like phospholipase family protein [Shewanella eurypsychrophilus]